MVEDGNGDDTSVESKIKFRDVVAENLVLKDEIDSLKTEVVKVTKERDKLKEVVSDDIRARKEKRIMDKSNYTREDLDQLSLEGLDDIETTLKMAKREYTPVADRGKNVKRATLTDIYEKTPWGEQGR